MTQKPKALYLTQCNYTPETQRDLRELFEVIPSTGQDWHTDLKRDVEVLFLPRCIELHISPKDVNPRAIGVNYSYRGNVADSLRDRVCSPQDNPEALSRITSTAELTWALIFALHRNIIQAHEAAVKGNWRRYSHSAPRMLSEMVLGVIGARGRIGGHMNDIGHALCNDVYAWDEDAYKFPSYIEEVDILSINCSLNDSNHNMINSEALSSLPKGALVINTARGELLDHWALLHLLEIDHLGGAALDVLPGEFIDYNRYQSNWNEENWDGDNVSEALRDYAKSHSNLLLTPHIGGSCYSAWRKTEQIMLKSVLKKLGLGE